MNVLESCYWVCWISKVPNIEIRTHIIVVCDNKLCRNLRVPHHPRLFVRGLILLDLSILVEEISS